MRSGALLIIPFQDSSHIKEFLGVNLHGRSLGQGQDVAPHIKPKLTGPTSNLFVCPSRPNKAITARRRGGCVGVGDVTLGYVAVVKLTVGGNAPE